MSPSAGRPRWRPAAVLTAGLALGLVTACGGGGTTVVPPPAATGTPSAAAASPTLTAAVTSELGKVLESLGAATAALNTDASVKDAAAALTGPRAELQAALAAGRTGLKDEFAARDRDDTDCSAIAGQRDVVASSVAQALDAAARTTTAAQVLADGAQALKDKLVPAQAQVEQARTLLGAEPTRGAELNSYALSLQGLSALSGSSAVTAKEALDGAATAKANAPQMLTDADRVRDNCYRRAARP